MHEGLSPQEREVVRLVAEAEGKTNHQISRAMGLKDPTVKNYVASAMRKAGVDNRTALAVWWVEHDAKDGK